MRHLSTAVVMVLAGACFLSGTASAQLALSQRCVVESLDPERAEARLKWMRRCALIKAPPTLIDYGTGSYDYVEAGADNNWAGQNMYTSQSDLFEVNHSYVNKLYNSAGTMQSGVDADGFYIWSRADSRKKLRPLYPLYGSQYDINSTSNQQLFPHPTLASCNFYFDRNGTQPATGASFFLNGFCESGVFSGMPIGPLSGLANSSRSYAFTVPAGSTSVVFETSGGTGDVDLYVRFGTMPDTGAYDCRPLRSGNNEACVFSSPSAGTWYVMLRGYTDYSGVTFKSTFNQLLDGVPTSPVSGAQASEQRWTLEVPPGMSRVSFTLSGPAGSTGDADLYVKHGAAPTTTLFDCRPYIGGNSEVCTFDAPAAGTWHVMLRGWSAYTGVTLTGDYQ